MRPHSQSSSPLPRWELAIYVAIVTISYSYATFQLFQDSQEFRRRTLNGYGLLQPGWKILGSRYQDVMTSEWNHWKHFTLHPVSVAVYAGHVTGGLVISRLLPEWRPAFLLISSLLGVIIIIGLPVFALLLAHALLAYIVFVIGRRVWLLWLVVLIQLALTVFSRLSKWQMAWLPEDRESRVKFIICGAFFCLRFISFGVSYLKRLDSMEQARKEGQEEGGEPLWTLRDYLLYVFYLPTAAHGPYTHPDKFLHQIKRAYQPASGREVWWVCLQWLRPLLAALFLEWLHHYLFISAFSLIPYQLNKMNPVTVVAFAEWCTLVFQVQYMVFYGLARAIAIFDGVLIPELPACVQCMYQAQDGWRYFDRGEHHFILRNIYFALGGSRHGGFRQVVAFTVSFCFTCYWHGCHSNVLCMVFVLWAVVQLEVLIPALARRLGILQKVEGLSGANQRRGSCLLYGIKYPVHVWAVAVFLSSVDVGKTVLRRVCSQVWVLPSLFVVHYCHVQLVKQCEMRWGKEYLNEKLYMAPPAHDTASKTASALNERQ